MLCIVEQTDARGPVLGPCPVYEEQLPDPPSGLEQAGPTPRQRRAQQNWDKAQEKLSNANQALQNLSPDSQSDCAKDLSAIQTVFGKTLQDIKVQANNSEWKDGTTSTDLEADLYSPVTGDPAYDCYSARPELTIGKYFDVNKVTSAQSALAISGLSGNIYFRPSYVNKQKVGRLAATMIHEVLHSLGFDDGQAQSVLGVKVGAASINITNKLYDDRLR
jgi:hypothetical protein